MKKCVLLMIVALMMMFTACGKDLGSGGNSDVVINEAEELVTEQGDSAGYTNELNLLTRESDEQYFTPQTKDYVFQITRDSKESGSEKESQEAYLVSFNDKGELVQCVFREIDESWEEEPLSDFHRDQGSIKVGDAIYTDMFEIFAEDSSYGYWSSKYGVIGKLMRGDVCVGSLNTGYSEYYISMPITSQQTIKENIHTLDEFTNITGLGLNMLSEDYVISKSNRKSVVEEDIDLRESFNGEPLDTPQTMCNYNGFSYSTYSIRFFGTDGLEIGSYFICELDSEDMIEDFFKYDRGSIFYLEDMDVSGQRIWNSRLSELAIEAMNNEEQYIINGKYIITSSNYQSEEIKPVPDYSNEESEYGYISYHSMPYLTDSQLANDSYLLTGSR